MRIVRVTLDSKKQALVIRHAITMPVVVQTREYDEQFYEQIAPAVSSVIIDTFIKELF